MSIFKRAPLLDLGDTGGLRVNIVTNGLKKAFQFTIFEWSMGVEVDRATVRISIERGVELVKILCKLLNVKVTENAK